MWLLLGAEEQARGRFQGWREWGRARSELGKGLLGGNPRPRGGDSLSHSCPVIGEVSQQQTGESLFSLCFVKVHDVIPRKLSVTQHVLPGQLD